jgi:hypothetical protein
MANDQSPLTQAGRNLPNTGIAATRDTIYESVHKAQLSQLRGLRPPLPKGDVVREEVALDQAIA